MRFQFAASCLFSLLSLSFVMADTPCAVSAKAAIPSPANATDPKVAFEKYTLSNGLQVILHQDKKLPIVHVNLWYHVGSKNERQGRTGFAHLFEHMMFQGSKNAGDYLSYVEKMGSQEFNGTTSFDRTNYFATVPSGSLERLLWLESDRLATLADALTQQKLDNQRDVVKNERRQGLENEPYGRAFYLLMENLFPAGHPYSHDVIGSQEDLTAANVDDVKAFFRTYYTPNNLSLAVTGDFEPAEAKRLIEKYFGPIPPGPVLDRPKDWVPKVNGQRIVEAYDHVPQDRTYIAWITPGYFKPDDAELDLGSQVMTDGLSSRLYKTLVYDKQLCTDVSAFNESLEIAGMFAVIATARPGVPLSQIEDLITAEIAQLAKTGPTAKELSRVKSKHEFGFISGLERIGGFGGQADLLNQYNTYLGDPGRFDADLARYRTASTEGVRQAVDRWLNTPNRLIVRFHPETSSAPAPASLDRVQVPPTGEDHPFTAPEVKTAKLDNGMQVFVVERPELPRVAVRLGVKFGDAADTAGKEGVSSWVASLMNRGTKTKKALEIDDAFGDLGTSSFGTSGTESSQLGADFLKANLDPGLTLLSDVARNATYPEEEIERVRKQTLDNLTQSENDPNSIASRVRDAIGYGLDHPYGRVTTPASIKGITREDLVRFHDTYWKPGGAALVFVGDVTLDEAKALAQKHFGSWTGASPAPIQIPPAHAFAPGKVYLVDRPDSAQTVVAQILPGPKRISEDYYNLALANAVWSGDFGSRLNLNLRQDKGYSYGTYSFPSLHLGAGLWVAGGGVQTDKTKESVVEFVKELKGIAGDKPITDAEFQTAKEKHVRSFAQQFDTQGSIAGQILNLWVIGLPFSEFQHEIEETQKATLSGVNATAQKYAQLPAESLLLVGDRQKIEPGLKELNVGDIVLLDPYGKPAK